MAEAWEDTFDEVKRKNENLKRKRIIDGIREKVPAVDPDLVFLTPREILDGMNDNPTVMEFHRKLLEEYECPKRRIGLLFPASDRIPWTKGTDALIYRNLYASLKKLELEDEVALFSISPLLGVVPWEWYETMPMYEASGAASFLVRRRGLTWNAEEFREVIKRAGGILNGFLVKNHDRCQKWHIIYRTPSVHERILGSSNDIEPFSVWPHTTKKSLADSYLNMRKLLEDIKEE